MTVVIKMLVGVGVTEVRDAVVRIIIICDRAWIMARHVTIIVLIHGERYGARQRFVVGNGVIEHMRVRLVTKLGTDNIGPDLIDQ